MQLWTIDAKLFKHSYYLQGLTLLIINSLYQEDHPLDSLRECCMSHECKYKWLLVVRLPVSNGTNRLKEQSLLSYSDEAVLLLVIRILLNDN